MTPDTSEDRGIKTYDNLVGGRWVGARSGELQARYDPADTSQLVARSPAMDPDDVAAALDHAASAAVGWARTNIIDRGQILVAAGALVRERADQIAADITKENGKTLAESRMEVVFAAGCFEYFGSLSRDPLGSVLGERRPGVQAWYKSEPLGVVVLITPWNDPVATPTRKLAPALLAGNAVVFKPGTETPMSTNHLCRALHDAGLPPGVLNAVTGRSSVIGPVLLGDARVQAVSFTGSTPVGLALSRSLGGTTTRLQAEMGGKNAALVLEDADIEGAVDTIVGSACGQAGQRCTATSRLVVQSSVAEQVKELLVQRFTSMRVGPGNQEGVTMGPLATGDQLRTVLDAVDLARSAGATIACGGQRLVEDGLDRGYFVAPAVVTDVSTDMQMWREEIFGPVLAVITAESFDEGVRLVNDSQYGLTASVFTRSLRAAHQFADEVETGQVAINLPSGGWDFHVPFGGAKESGSAFKENGAEGLRFYTRVKSIAMALP